MNGATKGQQAQARSTFALMGLAALLIANSHLEAFYPKRFMAADGLLGNLLFFLLSGYGVTLSQRKRPDALRLFYWRRLIRIYPSLWVAVLVAWVAGAVAFSSHNPIQWLAVLCWPTPYAFVAQIMIYYPAVWVLARMSLRAVLTVTMIVAALWAGMWILAMQTAGTANLSLGQLPDTLWWPFYLLATCLGAVAARMDWGQRPVGKLGGLAAILLLAYLAVKFELTFRFLTSPKTVSSASLGGLTQLLGLGLALTLLAGTHSFNELIGVIHIRRGLEWIGRLSLQIYLLHMSVAGWVEHWQGPWVIRVALVFGGTLAVSWILSWALAKLIDPTTTGRTPGTLVAYTPQDLPPDRQAPEVG